MNGPAEKGVPTLTSFEESSFKCDSSMEHEYLSTQNSRERGNDLDLPFLKIEDNSEIEAQNFNQLPLSGKITCILRKTIENRRKEEVDILVNYFKNVPYFKAKFDFQSKTFRDTLNTISTMRVDKSEIVFNYGEQGSGFFVVLSGTVSVLIPNPLIDHWQRKHNRYIELKEQKTQFDERVKIFFNKEILSKVSKNKDARQAIRHKFDNEFRLVMKEFIRKLQEINKLKKKAQKRSLNLRSKSIAAPQVQPVQTYSRQITQIHGFMCHDSDDDNIGADDLPSFKRTKTNIIYNHMEMAKKLGLTEEDIYMITEYEDYSNLKWFVEVQQVSSGGSFGEMAYTNEAPRAATIKCLENCNFVVFSGSDFKRLFRRMEAKSFAQKWHFLSDLKCLSHQPQEEVQKLSNSFQLKYVTRNAILCEENQEVNWIYLIFKGEFEILKTHYQKVQKTDIQIVEDLRKTQYPKPTRKFNRKFDSLDARFDKSNPNSFEQYYHNMQALYFSDQKMGEKSQNSTIKVSTLSKGQFVGLEDVMSGRNKYSYKVKCLSDGQVYCIKAQEFMYQFKKDKKTWSSINQSTKLQSRQLEEAAASILKTNQNKIPSSKMFQQSRVQQISNQRDPTKMFKTFTSFIGEVPILTHVEQKRIKFKKDMEAKQKVQLSDIHHYSESNPADNPGSITTNNRFSQLVQNEHLAIPNTFNNQNISMYKAQQFDKIADDKKRCHSQLIAREMPRGEATPETVALDSAQYLQNNTYAVIEFPTGQSSPLNESLKKELNISKIVEGQLDEQQEIKIDIQFSKTKPFFGTTHNSPKNITQIFPQVQNRTPLKISRNNFDESIKSFQMNQQTRANSNMRNYRQIIEERRKNQIVSKQKTSTPRYLKHQIFEGSSPLSSLTGRNTIDNRYNKFYPVKHKAQYVLKPRKDVDYINMISQLSTQIQQSDNLTMSSIMNYSPRQSKSAINHSPRSGSNQQWTHKSSNPTMLYI